jgi:hypothetical protein
MYYGREDFRPHWPSVSIAENFRAVLSRARPKDLAHDYLDRADDTAEAGLVSDTGERSDMSSANQSVEKSPIHDRTAAHSINGNAFIDEVRKQAVEAWRAFRASQHKKDEPANVQGTAHARSDALDERSVRDRRSARDNGLER